MEEKFCDLSTTPTNQLQTAAFVVEQELPRGTRARLWFVDEPTMVLNSLNLRLRNNLSWTLTQLNTGGWEALVQRAEEVPPHDVLDALKRDHKHIDGLFSRVIHLTDRGALVDAAQIMREFVAALERHLEVEHGMLAQAIRTPPNGMGIDPTAAMMAEHREILNQSAMICLGFEESDATIASVSPLLAILAGYLSKHEQREELSLFPIWTRALANAPQAARDALFERVKTQLGYGGNDGRMGSTTA
jgi:hypothetical protein